MSYYRRNYFTTYYMGTMWYISDIYILVAPEVTMSVSPEGLLREYQSVRFVCLVKAKPTTIKWKYVENTLSLFTLVLTFDATLPTIIIIIIIIRFIHHFLRDVLNQECLYHSAT